VRVRRSFDSEYARAESRFGLLGPQARAAVHAAIGQALLPLYERFVERFAWGDTGALREGLAVAAEFALGNTAGNDRDELLDNLDRATPHGDDFPSPDSTYAQDAVIMVDAAVRYAAGQPGDPAWLWYAFEPLLNALTEQRHGALSVSSAEEDEWFAEILDVPAMAAALQAVDQMIARVEGLQEVPRSTQAALVPSALSLLPPDER
jgi:hypothetical protein